MPTGDFILMSGVLTVPGERASQDVPTLGLHGDDGAGEGPARGTGGGGGTNPCLM